MTSELELQASPREADLLPFLSDTPLVAALLFFPLQPRRHYVIPVVKGTFDLVPHECARLSAEQEFFQVDSSFEDGAQPLRYSNDGVFFKPRADVFVDGHVYGRGASSARAEVVVGDAIRLELAAIGDREWTSSGPTPPRPFDRVPLRPELAFGGPGYSKNPIGRGFGAEPGTLLPNLERADALIMQPGQKPPPAITTPIPWEWSARRKRMGTFTFEWAKTRWPSLPEDFDWGFFNSASVELQCPYPKPGEQYRLAGLHPDHAVLAGRLPLYRPRAVAQSARDPNQLTEIRLNLDTIRFEPDRMRVLLVWRGAIEVRNLFASDLGSVFFCAEDDAALPDPEIRSRFQAAYAARYTWQIEEEEPEAPESESAPSGFSLPTGITPTVAAALRLPAWTVSVSEPGEREVRTGLPPRPAMTRAELERLVRQTDDLSETDFSACDLSGLDFSGRALSRSLFMGARLDQTRFDGARLDGAIFARAQGRGASFRGAMLHEADLSHGCFDRAVFDDADLRRATFHQTDLGESSMRRVDASDASFTEASLLSADFEGATLRSANLSEARIDRTVLRGANLTGARLHDAVGYATVFDASDLTGAGADRIQIVDGSFVAATLKDASVKDAHLPKARFVRARLDGALLSGSFLEDANFEEVQACAAAFKLSRLRRASLVRANLAGATLDGADLTDASLQAANLYRVKAADVILAGANLLDAHLIGSSLDPAP